MTAQYTLASQTLETVHSVSRLASVRELATLGMRTVQTAAVPRRVQKKLRDGFACGAIQDVRTGVDLVTGGEMADFVTAGIGASQSYSYIGVEGDVHVQRVKGEGC